MSYAETLKEAKKLAKRADQRLVRLERLSKEPLFENVDKYAYKNAMRAIKKWSGADAIRFNRNWKGMTEKQIKKKMVDIMVFLNSPTSQKSTILKTYNKRAQTINDKYGVDLTWEEIANYYKFKKEYLAGEDYGSETEIKAVGRIKEISDDPEKIKEVLSGKSVVSKDDIVNEVAKKLLSKDAAEVFAKASKVVKVASKVL